MVQPDKVLAAKSKFSSWNPRGGGRELWKAVLLPRHTHMIFLKLKLKKIFPENNSFLPLIQKIFHCSRPNCFFENLYSFLCIEPISVCWTRGLVHKLSLSHSYYLAIRRYVKTTPHYMEIIPSGPTDSQLHLQNDRHLISWYKQFKSNLDADFGGELYLPLQQMQGLMEVHFSSI